jgi:heme/copper-type cytochrome/quinol oxidase subunit 2
VTPEEEETAMPSAEAIQEIWIWSLVSYFTVVIVVAALLTLILITVRQIHRGAAAIWTTGQKVANNTIHIVLLVRTNYLAAKILAAAGRAAGAVGAVERHARACSYCPRCLIASGRK